MKNKLVPDLNRDARLNAKRPASRFAVRTEAAKRALMLYGFSRLIRIYVVTEFPKSGGTWFSQMLSTYLELPFARNNNSQPFRSSVLHGVFRYNPLIGSPTVVLRDGRDVMVSAYYHFLHLNETNLKSAVEQKRQYLGFKDFDDIHTNLPRFIEYMFDEYAQPVHRCSWSQFMDSWLDRPAVFVRYEDLLKDCQSTMARVISELTNQPVDDAKLATIVDQYSWRRLAGRKPGSVKKGSFMRKGIAGDWKNNFSRQAAIIFDQVAGEALVQWGYEHDRSWVEEFSHSLNQSTTSQSHPADLSREESV